MRWQCTPPSMSRGTDKASEETKSQRACPRKGVTMAHTLNRCGSITPSRLGGTQTAGCAPAERAEARGQIDPPRGRVSLSPRWGRFVTSACLFLVAAIVGLANAPLAAAEGVSIAGATPVVYGQQEFGNTINGGEGQDGCGEGPPKYSYRSWWALPMTAGDEVKVDWETHQTRMNMNLFAVGITDYTFLNTEPIAESEVNSNFKEEMTYTASQTGILPLEFHSDSGCGNEPGTYNFTASVLHAVVLSVPVVKTLPVSGTISVGVHNPDGVPISDPSLAVTFDVMASGSPVGVGSAPVLNGTATIPFTFAAAYAGHSVTIEARSSGTAYLPGSSATELVTVAKPVVSPNCVVPGVHHGETLAQMESAIRRSHCAVGHVHRVRSRHHRSGTVLAVSPRPSSHVPSGTPVSIAVSR